MKEEKNKFEQLMEERNYNELKSEGKTKITKCGGVTISKYATIRLPYYLAKRIFNDKGYCFENKVERGDYDNETKTIIVTALYPITLLQMLKDCNFETIEIFYTYGV